MQLPEIDFRSLEVREIGDWPLILRIAVIIAACIAALVLAYFLLISGAITELDDEEKKLEAKQKDFKEQYTMAVNFDAYKAQMEDMRNSYQDYIKELPTSSNIPDLIDTLTKTGEKNGLKISGIKLGDPKLIAGFYMALPLSISMSGGYHNFGLFISDVSKMARIVSLNDFTIKPVAASDMLQMDMEAQTYWLASPIEITANKPAEVKKPPAPGPEEPAVGAGPGAPPVPGHGPPPPPGGEK